MLLEFEFQWLESLLCVLAAASKLSQHRYNRKPLLKEGEKEIKSAASSSHLLPSSSSSSVGGPNNGRIWSRILMMPAEAPERGEVASVCCGMMRAPGCVGLNQLVCTQLKMSYRGVGSWICSQSQINLVDVFSGDQKIYPQNTKYNFRISNQVISLK